MKQLQINSVPPQIRSAPYSKNDRGGTGIHVFIPGSRPPSPCDGAERGQNGAERGRTKLPKTLREFTHSVANSPTWRTARVRAESTDGKATRVIFWLASDPERQAFVSFEHGRLIVTVDPKRMSYWFDLSRLHEHARNGWSWQQQLAEKNWCQHEHIALINELCRLFPLERDQ